MTNDWQYILDADETIRWQGRPDSAAVYLPRHFMSIFFGVFMLVCSVLWIIMAVIAGGAFFWAFAILNLAIGVFATFFTTRFDGFVRSRTWYTLTNRRAFIATDIPVLGRKLKSYPITAATVLVVTGDTLKTINFASRTIKTKRGNRYRPIGFDRLADADTVLGLMRQVQRGPES